MKDLDYWEKLKALKMSSQERRRERYLIIFLWKISQGLVNGYNIEFTNTYGRRGRTAIPGVVVQSSPAQVRRARECSLAVKGAKIFNLLPNHIRNTNSEHVELFKCKLDTFLSEIPDQPTVAGLGRASESNSLLSQIPMFLLNN